jgi:hypothetical protein
VFPVRYGQTYRSCIYLEVAAERGRTSAESGLCHLLLDSPDDCRVDVRADGLISEAVSHILDGDWWAVGRRVRVGTLYGVALYRSPRVLEHTDLMTLAAVTADVAARNRRQN